jgi:hypothetical protein
MDIKHLEQVNGDGLELWRPVMKSPLPISPAHARAVFAALGVDAPRLELASYDVADLAGAGPAVTLVPVHARAESKILGVAALPNEAARATGEAGRRPRRGSIRGTN